MEKVFNGYVGSFAHAGKKGTNLRYEEMESKPTLVFDDSCLNQSDVSTNLMGKVKVFSSLSNFKLILANEDFYDIKLTYMGGLWVLIIFHANMTKKKFIANTSVVPWFSHLQQAMNNVFIDERVTWQDIEGKVIWVRAKELCGWTRDFVEEDENECMYDDVVSEEGAHEASEGLHKPKSLVVNSDVEEKKDTTKVGLRFDSNLKFPPGFTPSIVAEDKSNDMNILGDKDKNRLNYVQEEIISLSAKKKITSNIWNEEIDKSVCSDHFKSNGLLRLGGSILQVMGDMVKVGQTMGYNMEGCINNIEEIIKSQGVNEEGFNEFVKNTWKDTQVTDHHAMGKFMKKLKFLKWKIREWTKVKRVNSNNHKAELKEQLAEIDILVDKGEVQRVVNAGLFKGITICPSFQRSHLFYVNDDVFMCQWSESNINAIVKVLDCFYHAFGLRINMNKSNLIGLSLDNDKVVQAAAKIGCASLKTPFWYLGTKVGGLMSRIKAWDEIVSKFGSRLSKWKMKTLSIGDPLSKKPILVKWNKVLAPKDKELISMGEGYKRDSWRRQQNWDPRGGAEQSQFNALQMISEGIVLVDSRDRWSWSLEGLRDFSVASIKRVIDEKILTLISSKTR
nr:RNA-directed DNA polymerase, eukaryota [Tanacetum cinerariifolium]GEZ21239.1 RNA-directed DNA polymerase, eukaryota [Tanacetum cinerariifolium]